MKKILIGLSISAVIIGVSYFAYFKAPIDQVSTQQLKNEISKNIKTTPVAIQTQPPALINNSASFVPAKETVLNNAMPKSETESNNVSNEKGIESKKPQSANYG